MRFTVSLMAALVISLAFGASDSKQAFAQDTIEVGGLVGDPDAGAKVFKRCMACHTIEEGKNRVGPTLYGIIGHEAGAVEGYKYSKANQESGIVWTPEVISEYLENPRKYMPGTKMAFPGLKKPQQRVDVIAYIAANGGMVQ